MIPLLVILSLPLKLFNVSCSVIVIFKARCATYFKTGFEAQILLVTVMTERKSLSDTEVILIFLANIPVNRLCVLD